jgi:hypothetical protein
MDIEFGNDFTLAETASFGADMGDAVDHQHTVSRKLGIAGAEQFAIAACDQFVFGVCAFTYHRVSSGLGFGCRAGAHAQ